MRGADLQKLCDDSGLKPQVIYERAGISRNLYYNILSKANVSVRDLERIAKGIGAKAGDLLEHTTGVPESLQSVFRLLDGRAPTEIHRITNVIAAMFDVPASDNVVQFPSAEERTKPRWSDDFPVKPDEFNNSGDADFPLDLHAWEVDDIVAAAGAAGINPETPMTTILNAKEVRDGRVRSVKVQGDSMSPTLEPGWKIAVDLWEKNPKNDDVVLVYRKDEGMILGRWEKTKTGVRLLKDNDRYQPVPLDEGDQLVGTLLRIIDAPIPKRRKR